MVCYYPLQAFRSKGINPDTGKRGIVFNPKDGFRDLPLQVSCGQCAGCRLERSRQWAVRCVHEAQMYSDNCFITLTYSDEYLPEGSTLVKADFQKFMKRFRKRLVDNFYKTLVSRFLGRFSKKLLRKYAQYKIPKIRYFHCGEYGEKYARPHYHACIFNFDFPDKKLWKVRDGIPLYTSDILSSLWPFGFSTIGAVTFDSAAYVARYVMKKVTGKNAILHYARYIDLQTGEIVAREPEYVTMSRRPGIAKDWWEKYRSDVYPMDEVVMNGVRFRPPRYYDSLFEIHSPEVFSDIKANRVKNAFKHSDNNTFNRLRVREQVKLAQISLLKRDIE